MRSLVPDLVEEFHQKCAAENCISIYTQEHLRTSIPDILVSNKSRVISKLKKASDFHYPPKSSLPRLPDLTESDEQNLNHVHPSSLDSSIENFDSNIGSRSLGEKLKKKMTTKKRKRSFRDGDYKSKSKSRKSSKHRIPKSSSKSEFSSRKSSNDSREVKDEVDENIFVVKAIIGKKQVDGVDFYKVSWEGYGPEYDTWEPSKNCF